MTTVTSWLGDLGNSCLCISFPICEMGILKVGNTYKVVERTTCVATCKTPTTTPDASSPSVNGRDDYGRFYSSRGTPGAL